MPTRSKDQAAPTSAPQEASSDTTTATTTAAADTTGDRRSGEATGPQPAGEEFVGYEVFVGYVDDDNSVSPSAVFDLSGPHTVVTAQKRVYEQYRPIGVSRVLTRLAYAQGQQVPRAEAQRFTDRASGR